jgi:ADP-heptose:LPS heptosyltransferase
VQPPTRIVLSRLDRIGDLILSTPAIASIRKSFPSASVTIVCSEQNAVVMERSPHVDDVVVARAGEKPAAIGRRLRGAQLAVALAPQIADFRLVSATCARKRAGYTYARRFGVRFLGRLLLTDLGMSHADPGLSDRNPRRPVVHEVDQVLDLARLAGVTEIERELFLGVDAEDRRAIEWVPPGAVTVHLAPRWLSRGSTAASFFKLVEQLRGFGRPLVVTYAPESREVAAELRRRSIVDCVIGDLSFYQWAAVFERSACVLTVDTGATHVASAMKRPTVVLFEEQHYRLNSQEWSPYRVPSAVLCKPPNEAPETLARSREQIIAALASVLGNGSVLS